MAHPLVRHSTACHVVPLGELAAGMHTLTLDGRCSCHPEDDLWDEALSAPVWVHKELTVLT